MASGPNKEYRYVGYLYTGYPCGDSHKEFADEAISQREPNRYHSIEEMYQMAMNIGFTKDQINAFISQQESCWVYDEYGKIIGHASGWHWEFDWKKGENYGIDLCCIVGVNLFKFVSSFLNNKDKIEPKTPANDPPITQPDK